MTSLSLKADEVFQQNIEPLMIAIQHDAQMTRGHLYTPEELFQRAVALQLYAVSRGMKLTIDPDTKLVIMEKEKV